MNKYIPLNICPNPECKKKVWDYCDDTTEAKCRECKTKIPKNLHNLIGGTISKEDGMYVLSFAQYGEKSIFPDWDSLKKQMDELAKNDV